MTLYSISSAANRQPQQPRRPARIFVSAASVLLSLLAGCRAPQHVQLTVSVAASLTGTIEPLENAFQKQHPEVEFRNNFGSSGVLARQIEQGAPVDLFLSAASKPVDELIAKGMIAAGQSRVLLSNRLVLITPTNSSLASIAQLNTAQVRRVAIGDPQSVPAGQYALQSLQSAKLAEAIRGKLVFAKDVRQVLAYVETGDADAGFVYATDAASSPRVRVAAQVPDAAHDPILYPMAVIQQSSHATEAREFCDFLAAPEAAAVFTAKGFTVAAH